MAYDFSVPTCCMGKKSGSVRKKELKQNGSISNSLLRSFSLKWILVNLVSAITTLKY